MWNYVAHIWSAGQSPHFSDLYAQWWAAHEILLHGRNPYTPAVAHEIQSVIYGAPIASSSAVGSDDMAGGFAYPLYVVFLMVPTLWLPFTAVQRVFGGMFLVLTLVSLWLWLYSLRWRLSRIELIFVAVFTVGSFPVLQGIALQNLSLLAAFLIAASLASVVAGRHALAGALLAAATIKPQFTILLIPWFAFWTITDWRKRRPLAWSFLGGVALLMLSSEVLLPGWIRFFLNIVRAYKHYTYGHSLLDVWFTPQVGPFISTGLALVVLVLCWRDRDCPTTSPRFLLAPSLALSATLLVIPTLEPHAQLLLLPGFLWLLCYRRPIWNAGGVSRVLFVAAWTLLAWPWIAAAGLTLAALWLPSSKVFGLWMLPLYTSPLLPFGICMALGFLRMSQARLEPKLESSLESKIPAVEL